MHLSLNIDLHTLDTQQLEAHNARIVRTDEYRKNHTKIYTEKHAPYPTHFIEVHLIDTSYTTATLAATMNNP